MILMMWSSRGVILHTSRDVDLGLDIVDEEEDGRDNNVIGDDFDDADMEDYWVLVVMTSSYDILPSMVLVSKVYPICIWHWHSHL